MMGSSVHLADLAEIVAGDDLDPGPKAQPVTLPANQLELQPVISIALVLQQLVRAEALTIRVQAMGQHNIQKTIGVNIANRNPSTQALGKTLCAYRFGNLHKGLVTLIQVEKVWLFACRQQAGICDIQ